MGVGALGLGAGHADHALMLVACDEVAQAPQALTMLQLRLRALGVRVTVLRQDLQMVFAQLQSSEVRQPREESRRSTEFHWERLEEGSATSSTPSTATSTVKYTIWNQTCMRSKKTL